MDGDELILQPLAGDRVDRTERLIHEQHRRVRGQRAGNTDALLLAAGELAGEPVAVGGRVKGDEFEQLVDAGADPAGIPAEHLGHQSDVLGHRHVREQPAGLDDVAQAAAQPVGIEVGDVLPVDEHPAGAGFD